MRGVCYVLACVVAAAGLDAQTPPRRGAGRGPGSATLAIFVTDPSGTPVPDVIVTVEGPANRSSRTEGGRIAFEGLPPGGYRLRFEREGFIPLERELTVRSGPPTDVKVTLKPAPEPPKPIEPPKPVEPPKPAVTGEAAMFDVPAVFEKEYVGRAAGRATPLACGGSGSATLIQVRDPIAQHAHPQSDEFLYVIGGEGRAQFGGREERLKAGVLLFVPRGMAHALSATGRNPLVVVSTLAGEGCRDGG